MRRAAYIDESETGKGVCGCMAIAAAVAVPPRGTSYLVHFTDLVEELRAARDSLMAELAGRPRGGGPASVPTRC